MNMRKIIETARRLGLKKSDCVVIIGFFVILLVLFLFFYRRGEYVTIRTKVSDQDGIYSRIYPSAWYSNRFEVGDKEIDALGRTTAEIVNIDSYYVSNDRKATYLDIRLKATYDSRTSQYYYKGKALAFGAPLRFIFSKIAFDSFVSEPPKKIGQSSVKYIAVIAHDRGIDTTLNKAVEPDVYLSLKKGDKILNSNKTLLAEILEITTPPAQRVTETASGALILQEDPLYKDAYLTLSVRVTTYKGEQFMFDNLPFKVGEKIPLNFPSASIFPVIVKIF